MIQKLALEPKFVNQFRHGPLSRGYCQPIDKLLYIYLGRLLKHSFELSCLNRLKCLIYAKNFFEERYQMYINSFS